MCTIKEIFLYNYLHQISLYNNKYCFSYDVDGHLYNYLHQI